MHSTFRLITFEDRTEGGVHMAMVAGDLRQEPTLVRVHVIDPLRICWRRVQRADEPDVVGGVTTGCG